MAVGWLFGWLVEVEVEKEVVCVLVLYGVSYPLVKVYLQIFLFIINWHCVALPLTATGYEWWSKYVNVVYDPYMFRSPADPFQNYSECCEF